MMPRTPRIKPGRGARRSTVFAMLFFPSLLVFLILWQLRSVPAQGQARSPLPMSSASFSNGGSIPQQFTCDGADLSPQLEWHSAPPGTKSLAIVMDDPDAPMLFTHWLVYNLAPGVRGLPQNASTHAASHQGAAEGTNSFGRFGYGGPCPPAGKPHHYVFRLYALDIRFDLPPGATRKQLDSGIERHILAEGQIIGTYQRASQ